MLSHDLHLYSELTALENLEFFGRLYGVGDPRKAAGDALERARLGDRGADLVSGFSRGMRQRLALERALLHNPRLLLLDEPFTGLDDASTYALIARLRELRASGCITLLATHDLDVAETRARPGDHPAGRADLRQRAGGSRLAKALSGAAAGAGAAS